MWHTTRLTRGHLKNNSKKFKKNSKK